MASKKFAENIRSLIDQLTSGKYLKPDDYVFLQAEVQCGGLADWQIGAIWAALRAVRHPAGGALLTMVTRLIERRQGGF